MSEAPMMVWTKKSLDAQNPHPTKVWTWHKKFDDEKSFFNIKLSNQQILLEVVWF